ncbi:Pvc16 family protein [Streptomyces fuscichromogenes]|uniref:Pvc16 family protein n=1 Tax=Streptomyces fuscichromogenes TaxID=1324013 RepID=UPI0038007ECD
MSMLRDADLSLTNWLASVLPPGTGIRFDAPRPDWERPGSGVPFVSLFLYDIRRDGQDLPPAGWSEVRDADGRLLGRQPAVRRYRISYTVTVWSGPAAAGHETSPATPEAFQEASRRAIEEHDLLGLLVDACTNTDTIADDHLTGALAEAGLPSFVRCGGDEPGRSTQGLWPGLGIAPRAHLMLELVAPVLPPLVTDLAPPAREIALGAGQLPTPGPTRPTRPAGPAPAGAAGTVRRWERRTITEPRQALPRPGEGS